jgi:hypothetical protein
MRGKNKSSHFSKYLYLCNTYVYIYIYIFIHICARVNLEIKFIHVSINQHCKYVRNLFLPVGVALLNLSLSLPHISSLRGSSRVGRVELSKPSPLVEPAHQTSSNCWL